MLDIIELVASLDVKMIRWLIAAAKRKFDFTYTELLLLWKIHKRSLVKISDLSTEVGMPPSTLTGVIDRFEKQGLIERIHDPKDRRSILVSKTPQLSILVEEWKNAVNADIEAFCSTLPEGFIEQFRQDLIILQQSLDRNEGLKHGRSD